LVLGVNFPKFELYSNTLTLDTPIEFIKGIGPERAKLLQQTLGINNVEDFLQFYPVRYLDKSKIYLISELNESLPEIQLQGKISELSELGVGRSKRLRAKFQDRSGSMELIWFQYSKWLKEQIPIGKELFIFGKITKFNNVFSMAHPEIEIQDNAPRPQHLIPIYPSSEKLTKRGLSQKFFRVLLKTLCLELPNLVQENLPQTVLEQYQLLSRESALLNTHFPQTVDWQLKADKRLKFEEAFFFQLAYGLKKQHHAASAVGHPFRVVGAFFKSFYADQLPFELTEAQKRVLKEIREDMRRPIQMNRLLQGDVGSGKTMVALLSMLLAKDNGFQSCLVAPTEILAQQHYIGISKLLEPTGLKVGLLTGSTKKAERELLHQDLRSGALSILIGTHAVFEKTVQFHNLGLCIIDEQHRFGVAQRATLWAKNKIAPHILVMTATPIPRTLAMSFYSDLDVSVIDELPVGRKAIITVHKKEKDRLSVYKFCEEEIQKGRQIYFVYPLIEESETLAYKNLQEGYAHITEYFKNYTCTMLHGKMLAKEKQKAMDEFARGDSQIMVATTVIEVGVNVPNASVMVIESTERFGLSQLHQLRGRVGRGADQSYCILMSSEKLGAESRKRIKTMCQTNDGFKISEVDLEIRGPGDMLGTQQSGVVDFKRLDLIKDYEIIKQTKDLVASLLKKDPKLQTPEHTGLKVYYLKNYRSKTKWSKIS